MAAASSVPLAPTLAQVRSQRGALGVPRAKDVTKAVGFGLGAAVATTVVTLRLFPNDPVSQFMTAAGATMAGAILAATSPPASIPGEIGLGGGAAGLTIAVLQLAGQLNPPPKTSGATKFGSSGRMTLRSGAGVTAE